MGCRSLLACCINPVVICWQPGLIRNSARHPHRLAVAFQLGHVDLVRVGLVALFGGEFSVLDRAGDGRFVEAGVSRGLASTGTGTWSTCCSANIGTWQPLRGSSAPPRR